MPGNYFTEGPRRATVVSNPVGDDGAYVLAMPPPMVPVQPAALAQVPATALTVPSVLSSVVKVVVVIIGVLVLLWLLDKLLSGRRFGMAPNPAARRFSTAELAGMLHERLARREDADPMILKSLAAYAGRR